MTAPPFTRRTLAGAGLTRRGLEAALLAGEVVQPLRGVYLRADEADDPALRLAALGLAMPTGAVACRVTAAWAWGVDARAPGEHLQPVPLQCVVPRGQTVPRRRGLRGYVAEVLDDEVTDRGGVLLTTPGRTALDVARWCRPHVALAALDQLARLGLLEPQSLLPRLARLRGYPNVDQARRLLAWVDLGAESPAESWLRLRLLEAGFPPPQTQISITAGGREVWRLDLGWPDRRIGIEYDGEEFHGTAAQQAHDRRRRADLAARFGWTVLGVTRGEVLGSSTALETGVGEILGVAPTTARRRW